MSRTDIYFNDGEGFPHHFYEAPLPQFTWLGMQRYLVYPAGNYGKHVAVEAVNEWSARTAGAIRLGCCASKVKVVKVAAELEGSARA